MPMPADPTTAAAVTVAQDALSESTFFIFQDGYSYSKGGGVWVFQHVAGGTIAIVLSCSLS